MLWMLQRVLFGKITNEENASLLDLNQRELGLILPLLFLMLFMIGQQTSEVVSLG